MGTVALFLGCFILGFFPEAIILPPSDLGRSIKDRGSVADINPDVILLDNFLDLSSVSCTEKVRLKI